ncbi:hypothetical protein DA391_00970 [Yersinia massiliensis]|uniref:Uncharacterized protein n=1 Tax=Yersinia massiliensis TaxID=419257 RepID=A0ABM6UN84_9GAMM|nr:hypothetical protein CRN74_18120 [Yersinia frederiksenii]AVX36358.1 hypothetical protein DA391_00970 [Yersinia massiliensis]
MLWVLSLSDQLSHTRFSFYCIHFSFREKKAKTESFQLKMNEIRNLSKIVKNHPSTTLEVYETLIDLHQ